MPILSKNPYIDADGNEYPFLALNLITRAQFAPKTLEAPTVLNLTPYRVLPDGTHVSAPQSAMKTVLVADMYKEAARDPAMAAAMQTVLAALADLIDAKGL